MILSILPYIQIIVSVLLIAAILLQKRGAGLGSAFGGGDTSSYAVRRGLEKSLFVGTIILAALFLVLAFLSLILR